MLKARAGLHSWTIRSTAVPDGFHPPLEEYLETIYSLEEEGVVVIQARLVERLGHSAQSVSEMVHRLESEGYLERRGRGVALTGEGRSRAESVVRKHRLAERFLVEIVGLPWHRAHVEAGRWEHVISEEVESRFVAILGNPSTCPHGNPIPGAPQAEGGAARPVRHRAGPARPARPDHRAGRGGRSGARIS